MTSEKSIYLDKMNQREKEVSIDHTPVCVDLIDRDCLNWKAIWEDEISRRKEWIGNYYEVSEKAFDSLETLLNSNYIGEWIGIEDSGPLTLRGISFQLGNPYSEWFPFYVPSVENAKDMKRYVKTHAGRKQILKYIL